MIMKSRIWVKLMAAKRIRIMVLLPCIRNQRSVIGGRKAGRVKSAKSVKTEDGSPMSEDGSQQTEEGKE